MRVLTVRDGLTESTDELDAVAVDEQGHVLGSWGNADRALYYRSAIKPIQATVALEAGSALVPEHLAVACASHSAYPIHLAIVHAMLEGVGLHEDDLGCPPAWPLEEGARQLLVAEGERRPRAIFHNCSGKHASFLRACVAQDWPRQSYLDPNHPLQRRVIARVADVSGVVATPLAVDGCGAPGPRGTVRGLAHIYSRLTTDQAFRPAVDAMHRYGALVSGAHRIDALPSRWWGGALKIGAEGLVGAGRHGLGISVKSRSGSRRSALVGLMEVMRLLGVLSEAAQSALAETARPTVLGGGRPRGAVVAET